jgi:hypothetical protein
MSYFVCQSISCVNLRLYASFFVVCVCVSVFLCLCVSVSLSTAPLTRVSVSGSQFGVEEKNCEEIVDIEAVPTAQCDGGWGTRQLGIGMPEGGWEMGAAQMLEELKLELEMQEELQQQLKLQRRPQHLQHQLPQQLQTAEETQPPIHAQGRWHLEFGEDEEEEAPEQLQRQLELQLQREMQQELQLQRHLHLHVQLQQQQQLLCELQDELQEHLELQQQHILVQHQQNASQMSQLWEEMPQDMKMPEPMAKEKEEKGVEGEGQGEDEGYRGTSQPVVGIMSHGTSFGNPFRSTSRAESNDSVDQLDLTEDDLLPARNARNKTVFLRLRESCIYLFVEYRRT